MSQLAAAGRIRILFKAYGYSSKEYSGYHQSWREAVCRNNKKALAASQRTSAWRGSVTAESVGRAWTPAHTTRRETFSKVPGTGENPLCFCCEGCQQICGAAMQSE